MLREAYFSPEPIQSFFMRNVNSGHHNQTISHPESHPNRSVNKKTRLLIIGLVIAGASPFFLVALSLALPWFSYKMETSRRATCESNLSEIGDALLAYQKKHDCFPPAYTTDEEGNPLHSWRTLILPFLGHEDLFAQVDLTKPWDAPSNQAVASEIPPEYLCGSADLNPGQTTYVAVIDPQGIMPGILPTRPRQILDGLSLTLIAVETDASNAVHWMSPKDITYATYLLAGSNPATSESHPGGHHILMADGEVMFCVENSPPDLKTSFVTIDAADDPLGSMFGTNANAVLPFKRNFHSTGTPAASQRYAEGIQTLRSITDPDDADAISEAISAFKWAAERGHSDAARQMANLSKTQAEQYAWFAVAAQNSRTMKGPFQAFQKQIGNSARYDSLAQEYLSKYRRGSRNANPMGDILTNGVDEFVKKGDQYLSRGWEGESLLGAVRKWYEMALDRRPNYPPALRGLGEVEGRLGQINKAAEYYREALRGDPNSTRILNSFAWTTATRGDSNTETSLLEEALLAAKKANALQPSDVSLQNTLGVCYYRIGKWEEAIVKLEESVKGGADIPHNWLFISMAKWQLDQKDEAKNLLTKAILWKQGKSPDAELKKFYAEAEALIGPIEGLADQIAARTPRSKVPAVRRPSRTRLSSFDASVYEMDVDGSKMREVVRTDGHKWHGHPAFSPAGTKLAWFSQKDPNSTTSIFVRDTSGQILNTYEGLAFVQWLDEQTVVVCKNGNIQKLSLGREDEPKLYSKGLFPSLSHNRRFLVFRRDNETIVMDLKLGQEKKVEIDPPARFPNRFSISDDGQKLAYVGAGEDRGVYLANLDSGKGELIADEPGADYWPQFSADGTHLLFTAGDFEVTENSKLNRIYVANIAKKTSRPITPENMHCRDASWASNGNSIVFVAVEKSVIDDNFKSNARPTTNNRVSVSVPDLPKLPAIPFPLGKETKWTTNWTTYGYDAGNSSFNPKESAIGVNNVDSLAVSWSNRHSSTIRGYVAVYENTAYYGDYRGQFRAVNASTGKVIWSKQLSGKHQGHAIYNDVIFVTSVKRLYALDRSNGKELWGWDSPGGAFTSPSVAEDQLYAQAGSPLVLHAINPKDGTSLWTASGGRMALAGQRIYIAKQNKLEALSTSDGKVIWSVELPDDNYTTPVISGDSLYLNSASGKLSAFDISKREASPKLPVWTASIAAQNQGDGPTTPSVDEKRVYVGSQDKFYAFDKTPTTSGDQEPVWVTQVPSPFFVRSPTIANGVVFSAAGNFALYAFEASTGKLLWKHTVPGSPNPIRSKPVVASGRLYHAATFGFKVLAFEPTRPVDLNE